jgi:RNase P/RNase MRP subunit p30
MDPYDIRAPADIVSFGRVLGFRDPAIKAAMSDSVLKENRKRLSGKWIMPGVELE